MRHFLVLALCALVASPAVSQEESKDPPKEEKLFRPFDQPVGDFKLQDSNGKDIRTRDLLGKIWVAQFFYPGCNLCSRNTPTVKRLQEIYRGKSDVRLVSIDLVNSPLETLQEFAKDHEAEPGQWLFLTGPEDKVHDVVRLDFFNMTFRKQDPTLAIYGASTVGLAVSPLGQPGVFAPCAFTPRSEATTLGDEIAHSTYLVLVDPKGIMVGYVDGIDPKAADALKEEIDRLLVRRRLEQPIPVTGAALPHFNAMLNSTCTILLLLGWIAIQMRWETLHKILMLLALAISMIFLASYLFYHFVVLEAEPMRFSGEGTVRYVYFSILLSHTILAILVAPLAIYITVQGLRGALRQHVRLARWTLPIWLYVSVTGVVVYWMLYRMTW